MMFIHTAAVRTTTIVPPFARGRRGRLALRLAVVGMGRMGLVLAERLLGGGHDVIVWDKIRILVVLIPCIPGSPPKTSIGPPPSGCTAIAMRPSPWSRSCNAANEARAFAFKIGVRSATGATLPEDDGAVARVAVLIGR
jgi:hypothetical protein